MLLLILLVHFVLVRFHNYRNYKNYKIERIKGMKKLFIYFFFVIYKSKPQMLFKPMLLFTPWRILLFFWWCLLLQSNNEIDVVFVFFCEEMMEKLKNLLTRTVGSQVHPSNFVCKPHKKNSQHFFPASFNLTKKLSKTSKRHLRESR